MGSVGESGEISGDRGRGSAPNEAGNDTAPRRETLVGVRNGDPQALSDFFEFCFDRVYSLAARLLGDRTAAQDVTQDVFLKIHRAAGTLDPDRNPVPWLTAITYNACRDHWRSQGHRTAKTLVSIDGEEAAGHEGLQAAGPDPEAAVLRGERERLVQDAVTRLPEELRVVVILRDYHGMRHEQIAELVGASHAAVRKRYSRALARLAEELKGVWDE